MDVQKAPFPTHGGEAAARPLCFFICTPLLCDGHIFLMLAFAPCVTVQAFQHLDFFFYFTTNIPPVKTNLFIPSLLRNSLFSKLKAAVLPEQENQ